LLDALLGLAIVMPVFIVGFPRLMTKAQRGESVSPWWWTDLGTATVLSGAGWLALLAVQAYLVTTSGQSIGKRFTSIKIVRMDGSPAGFVRGVLLRNWVLVALAYVPVLSQLSSLFFLGDALFIFRADRRCFHDHIAGTKVVRVPRGESPGSPSPHRRKRRARQPPSDDGADRTRKEAPRHSTAEHRVDVHHDRHWVRHPSG
jgi:uncharacterized RDD family membrane protein YckC